MEDATVFRCSFRPGGHQLCDNHIALACGIRGGRSLGRFSPTGLHEEANNEYQVFQPWLHCWV